MFGSLIEFGKVMSPWVLFAIIDFLGSRSNFPIIRTFSDQETIHSIYIILLIGSFVAFHNMKKQRDELASKLDRRDEINAVLENLLTCRERGVALRDQGDSIVTQNDIDDWKDNNDQWRTEVIDELRKLSPAEVGLFDTLDSFQPLQFSGISDPVVLHEMQMLFAETHRIEATMLRWQSYSV